MQIYAQIIDKNLKFGVFLKLVANILIILNDSVFSEIYSKLLNLIEESFENNGNSFWKYISFIFNSKEFKEEKDFIGKYKVSFIQLLILIFFNDDIELFSSMYKQLFPPTFE